MTKRALGRRVLAPLSHLVLSVLVASLVAWLVFGLWYPAPFDVVAGGTGLFFLIVSVDVCLGPALTAVIAAPGKPQAEFRRDLLIIVLVQLAGLGYGLYSLSLARPVVLAYEIDRFRVVTAVDVDDKSLADAPPELRSLSWTGPRVIAAVKPTDPTEQLRSIELGLAGVDLSAVPRNWRPYDGHRAEAWRAARPIDVLLGKYPGLRGAVEGLAAARAKPLGELRFMPLLSRRVSWSVILAAPDASVVGYVPVDAFF